MATTPDIMLLGERMPSSRALHRAEPVPVSTPVRSSSEARPSPETPPPALVHRYHRPLPFQSHRCETSHLPVGVVSAPATPLPSHRAASLRAAPLRGSRAGTSTSTSTSGGAEALLPNGRRATYSSSETVNPSTGADVDDEQPIHTINMQEEPCLFTSYCISAARTFKAAQRWAWKNRHVVESWTILGMFIGAALLVGSAIGLAYPARGSLPPALSAPVAPPTATINDDMPEWVKEAGMTASSVGRVGNPKEPSDAEVMAAMRAEAAARMRSANLPRPFQHTCMFLVKQALGSAEGLASLLQTDFQVDQCQKIAHFGGLAVPSRGVPAVDAKDSRCFRTLRSITSYLEQKEAESRRCGLDSHQAGLGKWATGDTSPFLFCKVVQGWKNSNRQHTEGKGTSSMPQVQHTQQPALAHERSCAVVKSEAR